MQNLKIRVGLQMAPFHPQMAEGAAMSDASFPLHSTTGNRLSCRHRLRCWPPIPANGPSSSCLVCAPNVEMVRKVPAEVPTPRAWILCFRCAPGCTGAPPFQKKIAGLQSWKAPATPPPAALPRTAPFSGLMGMAVVSGCPCRQP